MNSFYLDAVYTFSSSLYPQSNYVYLPRKIWITLITVISRFPYLQPNRYMQLKKLNWETDRDFFPINFKMISLRDVWNLHVYIVFVEKSFLYSFQFSTTHCNRNLVIYTHAFNSLIKYQFNIWLFCGFDFRVHAASENFCSVPLDGAGSNSWW